MAQQRQRVVIQMNIMLRLAKHYHAKPCPETGAQIKYDIKAFRSDPRKLEKWYSAEKPQKSQPENWEEIKQDIQQGVVHCYPKTQTTRQHEDKDLLTNTGTQIMGNKRRNKRRTRRIDQTSSRPEETTSARQQITKKKGIACF